MCNISVGNNFIELKKKIYQQNKKFIGFRFYSDKQRNTGVRRVQCDRE